jgi:hypothetical protein
MNSCATLSSALGFKLEDVRDSGLKDCVFDVRVFSHLSSFQMEHLVDLCSEDLNLVSDVLDTFCVQGRQRLESLKLAADRNDLSIVEFDAV